MFEVNRYYLVKVGDTIFRGIVNNVNNKEVCLAIEEGNKGDVFADLNSLTDNLNSFNIKVTRLVNIMLDKIDYYSRLYESKEIKYYRIDSTTVIISLADEQLEYFPSGLTLAEDGTMFNNFFSEEAVINNGKMLIKKAKTSLPYPLSYPPLPF